MLMNNSKHLHTFILIFFSLILFYIIFNSGCKRKSVNEPNNDIPTDTTIHISYDVDEAYTISRSVDATLGDTIFTQDSYGVSYKLAIPPNALQNNTTITMTPFKNLSIGGVGGDNCKMCGNGNNDCCHRGVLLQPHGLELDSTATLVIKFPDTSPFPFEIVGIVTYIDSALKEYEVCQTETDLLARTLTAKIKHFSGYGTDDANHDRLKEEIKDAFRKLGPAGTLFWPNLAYINELFAIHDVCTKDGYTDLISMIENGLYSLWNAQINWALNISNNSSDCEALNIGGYARQITGWYSTFSNGAAFDNLRNKAMQAYVNAMYRIVARGELACKSDSCNLGMELLSCARQAYLTGGIEDLDLIERINRGMGTCCKEATVTLTSNREVVKMLPLNRSNLTDAYAVLTVTVTGSNGKPKPNTYVYFTTDDINVAPNSGMTDSLGELRVVTTGYLSPDPDESGNAERIITAVANIGGEEFISEPITLKFKWPMVKITIDYSSSASVYGDQWATSTMSVKGTLSHIHGLQYYCLGKVTRSYSASYYDGSGSIMRGAEEYEGCPFDIWNFGLEKILIPNSNYEYVYYPTKVELIPVNIFKFGIQRYFSQTGYYLNSYVSYVTAPSPGYGVGPPGFPDNPIYFENNGSGAFISYSYELIVANSTTTLLINCDVSY